MAMQQPARNRMNPVTKWIVIGALAVLAGVAAGAFSLLWQSERPVARPETPSTNQPAPAAIDITLPGIIGAREVVSIPPPIEGVLEQVLVDVGDEVFEGMVLARIYNTAIETELELARLELRDAETDANRLEADFLARRVEASRAEAELTRIRAEYELADQRAQRQRNLYREGATPRAVYEKAQAEFEEVSTRFQTAERLAREAEDSARIARDALDLARRHVDEANRIIEEVTADLEASQVLSPTNGVVVGMAARQGEEVFFAMENLFQIAVDLAQLHVVVEPAPDQMRWIQPGQPALVYLAELPNDPLEGTVSEMRVGRVLVDFLNPLPSIRPGLTAQVTIRVSPGAPSGEATPPVPQAASPAGPIPTRQPPGAA